jgi:beta-lactamase regulating signal transducer with metallopeptidase domain
MNAIAALLDKPIFQALGWTLIHFIWQGALIAILYASVSVLLRRFSANVRYTAACGAMLLMLIAPATTMFVLGGAAENSAASSLVMETTAGEETMGAVEVSSAGNLIPAVQSEVAPVPAPQPNSMKRWAQDRLPRAMPWLLALWFAGVLSFSLRFAGGLVTVHRLKRTEASTNVQLWQEQLASLSKRLKVSRPVRLFESALVEVPTVIGWLRPVILLPATALTGLSAEQLEALLAHELAHIRRYDYLINLVQTSIETLFFYHPAVWWVSAQVRQEREHCCDDLAVVACGDVLIYARALTALEQMRCPATTQLAVAASGGSLLVRIQRLLRGRAPAFYGFESGFAGVIALATIFILLAGAQSALLSRSANAAVKVADVRLSDSTARAADQTADKTAPTSVAHHAADQVAPKSDTAPSDEVADVEQPAAPEPGEISSQEDKTPGASDFVSELTAAGLTNLKANQLNALRQNGITPQFVNEMSRLVAARLNADLIIAMRIHGVTAGFADELKAQGLSGLTADQLIAFRIHGVTSQYINELRNAGYSNNSADSLVAFKIHGVTPALIQQMKDIGYANVTGDQLTACGIHGVTPLFIQTMKTLIAGKLSIDDLLALRIHGVSPAMVKELEIMGYASLSATQLVAFRIHGVTPGFIKSIQDAGYDRITAEQLIELRILGVTPEFIQLVKGRGFTDVTLHQLAELRRLNILPSAKKN